MLSVPGLETKCQSPPCSHWCTPAPRAQRSLAVQLLTNRAVPFCHLHVTVCGEQLCHQTLSPDFIHAGFLRKTWLDFSLLAYSASAPVPKASPPGWREIELSVPRGIRKSTVPIPSTSYALQLMATVQHIKSCLFIKPTTFWYLLNLPFMAEY